MPERRFQEPVREARENTCRLTGRYHGDFSIQVEIFCVATAVIHEEKERRAQELTGRYHVHEEKESTGARSGGTREHMSLTGHDRTDTAAGAVGWGRDETHCDCVGVL
jgi:transcription initiation factor IIF auxiliary subunit